MSAITFDYSAISDAKSYAKKVVTGFGCMDDYQSGLKSSLYSPLNESRLSAQEPYGHGYVSCARESILNKQTDLGDKRQLWINLSANLDTFLQYLKDTENEVVNIFSATSSAYTNYSGVGGFFTWAGDSLYNFVGVDLANLTGLTRTVSEWAKEWADDLSYCKQKVSDWFRHGNGRYLANMVGSVAFTAAAVTGAVLAFMAIPFTGAASAVFAVECIGCVAASVSAVISVYNTGYTLSENVKALSIADDPGLARFHGDVSKFSDYVEKTDFGSAEANNLAALAANIADKTQAVADVVSAGCSVATTFGTKSVKLIDDAGRVEEYKIFDKSISNIKSNVLKTFGFQAETIASSVDEIGVFQSAYVSNADDFGDAAIDVVRASSESSYTGVALEKTAGGNKILTIDRASSATEYGSVVASNGYVTQEFAAYSTHASASTTVIDYTNAASTVKSVEAAKAASDSSLKRNLKVIKNTSEITKDIAAVLKKDDEAQAEYVIRSIVKENNLFNQVDKYVYKYDAASGKNYIGGDLGKKAVKLWKIISSAAA